MSSEDKTTILVGAIIFGAMVLICATYVAGGIYRDYQIGKAIEAGADPASVAKALN